MASYGSRRPEVWSRLLKHSGKGGKTYREAAEAYRKRAEELRAMADAIDNRIKTLDVGTSGDMWNSAMAAYQRFIQQLRQAAESTDETAERAEKQGEITDKARSSMPSVGTIMGVWSAYLAAKASHNYGLAAAMLAKYMGLWDTAASIMSGYDNSSSSNVDSVSAPSESPSIANQAAAAPLANNLLESWTPPHSDAGPEPNQHVPPSESPTLDRLNGGGGGGGGGVPVGMVAGLAPGTAVRVPATWNTGRAVGAPGM
ncbi:MAG: PPE domain-containing protein, partial [Mycobacteriaceae bacterium]|nr:PPE domain-containing protein [Mycobacteriaceae bacterium]